eukprot:7389865-Prymnesium_polylepis.1
MLSRPPAAQAAHVAALPSYAELYPPPHSATRRVLFEVPRHPALAVDLEADPGNLLRAAQACASPDKDLVVVTTDTNQLDIAVNLVANLADVGVPHYLVIAASQDLCLRIRRRVACVWTTLMEPFRRKLAQAGTNMVRAGWLCRQIYVGRLSRLGFNPMLLDADVILFHNPFPLIREHLPGYQAIFLGDTSAGYMAVNGGTVYVRGAALDGPVNKVWREFERRVFALLNTTDKFPDQLVHKTRRGMVGGPGVPADALLYDQNVLDWCIIGQLVGDENFVGRGFSSTMRYLTEAERAKINWENEPRVLRLPDGPSCPGGGYDPEWFPRSLALGTGAAREWMLKAPSWLFTAESDEHQSIRRADLDATDRRRYGRKHRITAEKWTHSPAPAALAHFVCTVWPGSDGRRLGMRLMRRWFQPDINWVIAAAATQANSLPTSLMLADADNPDRMLVAFSGPVPFAHHHLPTIRQKVLLHAWNVVLAYMAHRTRRTAVVPLFECVGLLSQHSRYGWPVHQPSRACPRRDKARAAAANLEWQNAACAYRLGTGCFHAMGYPEEVAQVRAWALPSNLAFPGCTRAAHRLPPIEVSVAHLALLVPSIAAGCRSLPRAGACERDGHRCRRRRHVLSSQGLHGMGDLIRNMSGAFAPPRRQNAHGARSLARRLGRFGLRPAPRVLLIDVTALAARTDLLERVVADLFGGMHLG